MIVPWLFLTVPLKVPPVIEPLLVTSLLKVPLEMVASVPFDTVPKKVPPEIRLLFVTVPENLPPVIEPRLVTVPANPLILASFGIGVVR